MAWLSIDQERRQLDVGIDAPKTVPSNRTVEVALSVSGGMAGEPAWLTLTAVDEGVLQLTDFASPDPVAHFPGQKDLGVEMRDLYGQLINIGIGEVGKLKTGHDAPSRQLEGLSERSAVVRPNFDMPALIQNLSLSPYGCVEQTSSRLLALHSADPLPRAQLAAALMNFGDEARARKLLAEPVSGLVATAYAVLDHLFLPDLSRDHAQSMRVLDPQGGLLRVCPTADEHFRFRSGDRPVDPRLIEMLVGFEDRRFWRHPGIDPLALLRALGQLLYHREVISGGSTITMQVARLLEPRPRTLRAKLIEMFRALQLDRRFGKTGILDVYLTLAPYGGPIEGIESASRFWLDKPPTRLTETEAALLVAMPQAPSRVRPDRYPKRALHARNKVLKRLERPGWQEAIAAPLAIKKSHGRTATSRIVMVQ